MLTGCGRRTVRAPRGYVRLKSQSFLIERQPYASIDNFCQVYSFESEWVSNSEHIFLISPHLTASLRCGSSIVLVDGKVEHLSVPVLIKKSNVVIPLELARIIDATYILEIKKPALFRLKTVVIDPGHGGRDPGAIGATGLKEKEVALDISLRLKRLLETEGIEVIATRESDRFISLRKRAHIANVNGADFFISIHANASRSRQPRGFEVYCFSDAINDESRAVEAAENAVLQFEESSIDMHNTNLDVALWDMVYAENGAASYQMADILCKTATQELKTRNRGVKTARFYVLKGVRVPAVLIEVGFISNRYEENNLRKPRYRQQIARALAKGILLHKKEFESTNGFTN